MSRLTDTQLVILSAASQRDDRGVELPANVKGEAARKAADKLIRAGLLEEVRAAGSLPVWRRDDQNWADGASHHRARARSDRRRGRVGGCCQGDKRPPGSRPRSRNTRSRGHRLPQADFRCNAEARSEEASPGQGEDQGWLAAQGRSGSKQARVVAMLGRPEGATIAAIMRDPLAAALGPRLLRRGGAQEARPRSSVREGRRQ